jgi:hypothetical protein
MNINARDHADESAARTPAKRIGTIALDGKLFAYFFAYQQRGSIDRDITATVAVIHEIAAIFGQDTGLHQLPEAE